MVKIDRLPSGSYRARVLDHKDAAGKAHYKTFTGKDRKAVQLKAAEFEAGKLQEKSDKNITVSEAMERYVESKRNVLSPKTYREYTSCRTNSLKSLHNIKISDLTQEAIQLAINTEALTHAPKTVRNMHCLLSSTLKMFRPDFALNTTLPQRKKPDIRIPTEEHMIKLFEYTYDTDIEIPVLLGAVAGMRMSEILGLKWKNINFENRTIRIDSAKVRDIDNNLVLKAPKSHAGYRTIRMLPRLNNELKRLYDPEKEFVTDLKANNIYKRYQSALSHICPEIHYTFHELRHYAASVMIMLGIPVKYIADMLGHETEDMVNRVYGHIMSDKQDIFYDRLDEYYQNVFEKCNFEKSVTKSVTNSDKPL